MPDSLTFVAWYFDDDQELKNLNHNFPGFIVFAHSDTNETTNAGDKLRILKIVESENVHEFLVQITQKGDISDPNIVLIRQHDDTRTRHIVYHKILEANE